MNIARGPTTQTTPPDVQLNHSLPQKFMIVLVLVLVIAALPLPAQAAAPPRLPPGARTQPPVAPERLGTPYRAEIVAVDWTNPLLKVSLEEGLNVEGRSPAPWAKGERSEPQALRLQLSEPCQIQDLWSLALPVALAPRGNSAAETGRYRQTVQTVRRGPYFSVGGLCPWIPAGPPLAAEPELVSPLSAEGSLLGVRWLGRLKDLDEITTLSFRGRCLLSWTQPAQGRSRFALVVREANGEGRLDDLRSWIQAESQPGEWLAIHSLGEYALAGAGQWRLTAPSDPRRIERLGVALRLAPAVPGDPVDWARLPDCTVQASSSEWDYPAANLLRGLLWPAPLAPVVWISRAGNPADSQAEPPWVELKFLRPRPVRKVVLVWAGAAGWSEQFNPRRVLLKLSPETGADLRLVKEATQPAGVMLTWQAEQPTPLQRLRVEFPEPSRMPLDPRARLCAIQAWGPWDGTTTPW